MTLFMLAFRQTSARRLAASVLALGLAMTLAPMESADAASVKVGRRYFGMTDGNPLSWPKAPVGAMRLWDSGVTWRQIETRRGVFDFTTLDAQVATARSHGARPLIVLGMTPRFHSTRPRAAGYYGSGSTAMPRLTAWKTYVAKVVRRYGAKADYQVWNEANVTGFWSGTPAQMALLTKTASQIVARNARSAAFVAPALATRLTSQRKWLRTFYAQRVGGRKVSGWVDVVSLNLYPLPNEKPEHSIALLNASRTMLRAAGVYKPIWNTEINYGLQTGGGGTARDISGRKQASYVARTYLLNAAGNVKRVFWYSWQMQDLANTRLTQSDGETLTKAGTAYAVVRGWMVGTRLQGCPRDSRGTYTCTMRYSDGVKRVYWNPSQQVSVRAVPSARKKVSLQGFVTDLDGRETLRVGSAPVMVQSRR